MRRNRGQTSTKSSNLTIPVVLPTLWQEQKTSQNPYLWKVCCKWKLSVSACMNLPPLLPNRTFYCLGNHHMTMEVCQSLCQFFFPFTAFISWSPRTFSAVTATPAGPTSTGAAWWSSSMGSWPVSQVEQSILYTHFHHTTQNPKTHILCWKTIHTLHRINTTHY